MKAYDTFNPNIPDAEEVIPAPTLPPVSEELRQSEPKRKEKKETVKRVVKNRSLRRNVRRQSLWCPK